MHNCCQITEEITSCGEYKSSFCFCMISFATIQQLIDQLMESHRCLGQSLDIFCHTLLPMNGPAGKTIRCNLGVKYLCLCREQYKMIQCTMGRGGIVSQYQTGTRIHCQMNHNRYLYQTWTSSDQSHQRNSSFLSMNYGLEECVTFSCSEQKDKMHFCFVS